MAQINGSTGPDLLNGTSNADDVHADAGDDLVFAAGGSDCVHAGPGNDNVSGQDGNDFLFGEGGNDRLTGQYGVDYIFGDAGNDQLFGGGGDDLLVGGADNDTLNGEDGQDTLLLNGTDVGTGGPGADRFIVDESGFPNVPTITDFNAAEGDVRFTVNTVNFDATVANYYESAETYCQSLSSNPDTPAGPGTPGVAGPAPLGTPGVINDLPGVANSLDVIDLVPTAFFDSVEIA